MSSLTIGAICMIIGASLWLKLRNINDFTTKEAKRYFCNFNKADRNWSSGGKMYTTGIALIKDKKTGKKQFIKQTEINDVGLLE